MKKAVDQRQETLKANKYVHTLLVTGGEYQKSPHFLPENRAKVRAMLLSLTADMDKADSKAIDFGCGTGFMLDLLKDQFSEVHGVDIAPAMLNQVDRSSGNVFLYEASAERTPFMSGFFDFATAYSFMDHLYDVPMFLREVHRVLRPGGVFFAGLNPNRDFIQAMARAETWKGNRVSSIVDREIKGALHNGDYYEEKFGVDASMLDMAEPIKALHKGFAADEVYDLARHIGFEGCEISHDWFLGQASVTQDQSVELAGEIDHYLSNVLPIASPLYKYLNFVFRK